MKALGEDIPGYKIRNIIDEADKDENGKLEFNEFLRVSFKFFVSIFLWVAGESELENTSACMLQQLRKCILLFTKKF